MEIDQSNYVTYHLHSDYSLQDSCTDYKQYIDHAKELGQTAIAFTEHGIPRGWVSKKLYCDKVGIKYIHGVEIYLTERLEPKVRDNFHTVLLAKNEAGVRELNALVSRSCDKDHFYYTNRISFEEFASISDNIIKTSACLASPLNKLDPESPWIPYLLKYYDFLEIQHHNDPDQVVFNQRLYEWSKQYGTPLIAGTDTHSIDSYYDECRGIMMLAKKKTYGNEDNLDLIYKSYNELVDSYRKQNALPEEVYLEAIANTNVLADLCEDFTLDKSTKYPILYGTQEADEQAYTDLCWKMLDEKLENGVIPREQEQAYRDAIKEELRVFKKIHMSGFMLSMSELIRWCKEQGMAIGTARGSVGGSRCAYVTDIIDMNPEQWHTVFSRFANEDRVEVADIDTDVIESDRPAIFQHVIERFGTEKTARVAAYGTLQDKAPISEICRALKIRTGDERYNLDAASRIKKEFLSDPDKARADYPDVFYYYDGLFGTRISQSVHPAGMVISPITLEEPYGVFEKDGERCLMLDMDEAHDVGLVKYDFLILGNVEIIRDACNYIGISYPKSYQMNFDDPAVWEDMKRSPIGIFQMKSPFAFSCLKKLDAKSIDDMSLVTAAIRPGAASYRDDLMAGKINHNPSPLIDEILSNSRNYLVYQEQTIAFLKEICGFSASESDTIRRAIGHKKKDIIAAAMPKIINGYCEKSDKPREVAEEEAKAFMKIIEDSASYQFNYSHSVAYCILGYYCAWLRYYHPIEFITSLLNHPAKEEDTQNGTYLAQLYGIKVENPKWGISRGGYYFDKESKTISKGLGSVKYMSEAVAEEMHALSQQKTGGYTYFTDLLRDLSDQTSLDSRQLDILIRIEFFSMFGNQRELLRIVEMMDFFGNGTAKQIKKDKVDGSFLGPIVQKYSIGVTKQGKEAKSYTITDMTSILHEAEAAIKAAGLEDLPEIIRIKGYCERLGSSYTSNRQEDRPKLLVLSIKPLKRRKDGKQFGYEVETKSIGSGKQSRFTAFNPVYNREPIQEGDIIYCKRYSRNDRGYFTLEDYYKLA